jgi:hypothetical protein
MAQDLPSSLLTEETAATQGVYRRLKTSRVPAAAEVIDLPIEAGPGLEYNWDNYLSKTEYQDPSLHVQVFEGGRIHDTNYLYAIVKIASPTQLRTAMAYKYNSKYTVIGEKMAEANNAVIAVNGDYFNYYSHGYLVRHAKRFRNRPNKTWDMLIIDQNGDFHTIMEPSAAKIEAWQAEHSDLTMVNTFNFGPVIIQDGQLAYEDFDKTLNHDYIGAHKLCQRMAFLTNIQSQFFKLPAFFITKAVQFPDFLIGMFQRINLIL